MRRAAPPPPSFSGVLSAGAALALALPELLCSRASAQPLEGSFAAPTQPPRAGLAPVKGVSLHCPDGYYRASGILFGCHGALGKQIINLEPKATVVLARLPVGLGNFSAQVGTSLNSQLAIEDARTAAVILNAGQVSPRFSPPAGNVNYRRVALDTEALLVMGSTTTDMTVRLENLARERGRVEFHYRFDGVRPCPAVPVGCRVLNTSVAEEEVRSFSSWAHWRYSDSGAAWKALSALALKDSEGSVSNGRRLGQQTEIQWLGWRAICNFWGGASSADGWQQTFRLLDKDRSGSISKAEFGKAYDPPPPASSSASGFLVWPFLLVPLATLTAFLYLKTHPAALTKLTVMAQDLRAKGTNALDAAKKKIAKAKKEFNHAHHNEAMTLYANDQEKTMIVKGGQDFRGKEDVANQTQLPAGQLAPHDGQGGSPGSPYQNRDKYCALMSCAFGRGQARRSESEEPLAPSADVHEAEAIVKRMRADKTDERLQEQSLRRLEDLALEPACKQRLSDCGGPEAVLEAMYAHPSSAIVQEHACAVLGNQASQSEAQQRRLVEQGAVRAAIKTMYEHSASFRVQEMACWALREMAITAEGRRDIQDCGGIERILRAMQTHPAAVALLEHGCMALAYLAYDSELRRWIAYDGGIAVVLSSMRGQHNDPVVQEAGCLALRNLSCSREPQQAILEQEGDDDVVQAMRAHSRSATVLETAADALHILSPTPERLVELGALELVVRAAEQHPSSGLQARACKLLAHAAGAEAVRARVQYLGGEGLAVKAQSAFPASEEVQDAAEQLLSVLRRVDGVATLGAADAAGPP